MVSVNQIYGIKLKISSSIQVFSNFLLYFYIFFKVKVYLESVQVLDSGGKAYVLDNFDDGKIKVSVDEEMPKILKAFKDLRVKLKRLTLADIDKYNRKSDVAEIAEFKRSSKTINRYNLRSNKQKCTTNQTNSEETSCTTKAAKRRNGGNIEESHLRSKRQKISDNSTNGVSSIEKMQIKEAGALSRVTSEQNATTSTDGKSGSKVDETTTNNEPNVTTSTEGKNMEKSGAVNLNTNTVATVEFSPGEIIWGKIRGWPHWPAKVKRLENKRYGVVWLNDYRTTKLYKTQMFKFHSNCDKFSEKAHSSIGLETAVKEALIYLIAPKK